MTSSWGLREVIASGSALIALVAMGIAIVQARIAKRQADAALGEMTPLVFLDSRAFEKPDLRGGRASLTVVNQNRRDIRLIEIEFKTDDALVVMVDTGELRDVVAAAYQRGRKDPGEPLIIDLREKHHVIQGRARLSVPLNLTSFGQQKYTQETADITAVVRYVLLDAKHTEKRVEVFATIPFRP